MNAIQHGNHYFPGFDWQWDEPNKTLKGNSSLSNHFINLTEHSKGWRGELVDQNNKYLTPDVVGVSLEHCLKYLRSLFSYQHRHAYFLMTGDEAYKTKLEFKLIRFRKHRTYLVYSWDPTFLNNEPEWTDNTALSRTLIFLPQSEQWSDVEDLARYLDATIIELKKKAYSNELSNSNFQAA